MSLKPTGILNSSTTDEKMSWEDIYIAIAQEQDEWCKWKELDVDNEDHL